MHSQAIIHSSDKPLSSDYPFSTDKPLSSDYPPSSDLQLSSNKPLPIHNQQCPVQVSAQALTAQSYFCLAKTVPHTIHATPTNPSHDADWWAAEDAAQQIITSVVPLTYYTEGCSNVPGSDTRTGQHTLLFPRALRPALAPNNGNRRVWGGEGREHSGRGVQLNRSTGWE